MSAAPSDDPVQGDNALGTKNADVPAFLDQTKDKSKSSATLALEKHYSCLGIGDVFLQPPSHALPISYLSQQPLSLKEPFVSSELVADIKDSPQDFVVQEIMDFERILPSLKENSSENNFIRIAIIDETPLQAPPPSHPPSVSTTAQSTTKTSKEEFATTSIRKTQIDWKSIQNHPKASLDSLLQESTLQLDEPSDLIVRNLQELQERTVEKLDHATYQKLSKHNEAVTITLRGESDRQDRGLLHRWVRCAFPVLHTEVASNSNNNNNNNDSAVVTNTDNNITKIIVRADDRFFGLVPFLCNPQIDIPLLYAFFRRGNDNESANAPTVKGGENPRSTRQTTAADHFRIVLPLRADLKRTQRRSVHQILSEKSGRQIDTHTKTEHQIDSGVSTAAIVATWSKKSRKRKRDADGRSLTNDAGMFTLFAMRKRNVEHSAAVHCLSKALQCRPRDIQFAGIKDRRAITTQFCTVNRISAERIIAAQTILQRQGLDIGGPLMYVHQGLKKGQAQGNRFTIILRKIRNVKVSLDDATSLAEEVMVPCEDRSSLDAAIVRLQQGGFLNFYGEQRIGQPGMKVRAVDIGRALLQQDWEKGIDLIMRTGTDANSMSVRKTWVESKGDVTASWNALSSRQGGESHQRVVLQSLKRYGTEDLSIVLQSVPFLDRTFWINAYQSFIWNSAATERIRLYGAKTVVVGDLVEEAASDSPLHITSDEMAETYSFHDVVLPLPGYKIEYPSNKVGDVYKDMLSKDRISFTKDAPATAAGSYRRLVAVAQNLQHEWLETGTSDCKLVFDLPSGSYATMLLRELFRTTISR